MITLYKAIYDLKLFGIIILSYLFIASTIFTCLFRVRAEEEYGQLSSSMLTLFDAMLGRIDPTLLHDHSSSYSFLVICHLLISYIVILNYLIALVSSQFDKMKTEGDYTYKSW